MMEQIEALSMSWRVARAIREDGWSGEIIAVHARNCYLTGDDAEIYAVVQEPLGNGPFNLVIRGPAAKPFAGLSIGASAATNGGRLLLGDSLDVGLERATLWDPKVYLMLGADPDGLRRALVELYRVAAAHAPEQSLARLLPYLHEEDLPASLEAVGHFPRSHALIAGLVESLARRNRKSLKVVTSSLAGLGPGLTPSGDDFLAGVLLALALVREQGRDAELAQIAGLLVETAAPRTHEISAAYLRAAHAGEASERWHPLLAAISAGDSQKLRDAAVRVLAFGETSGADMLAGFIAALSAIHGGSSVAWEGLIPSPVTRPSAPTLPPMG